MVTIVCYAISVYTIVLFIRIIWSWFRVPSSGPGRTIFEVIYDLTEPVLRLVRGLVPAMRTGSMAIDFSPILVFVGLNVLRFAIC